MQFSGSLKYIFSKQVQKFSDMHLEFIYLFIEYNTFQ